MASEYSANKPNLTFAKIATSPTPSSWAQAYYAGSLFAILSLNKTLVESEEATDLNGIGKNILNTLEEEFFTLEQKDLDSIKKAITTTIGKIPSDIQFSFVVGCIPPGNDTVLYVFLQGKGKVILKRNDKIGALLFSSDTLISSSGFIENNDTIVLANEPFLHKVTPETLSSLLERSPMEAAERIVAQIPEVEQEGVCGLIIHYQFAYTQPSIATPVSQEPVTPSPIIHEDNHESRDQSPFPISRPHRSFPKLSLPFSLNVSHPKKILVMVIIVVIAVMIFSVFSTIQNQESKKSQELFDTIYPQAQIKYDEGQSLITLNRGLARDSFVTAQKILTDAKPKFKKDSPQEEQIIQLLGKVDKSLEEVSDTGTIPAQKVDASTSDILSHALKNPDAFYTYDDKTIYVLNKNSVSSIDRNSNKATTLVKSTPDLKEAIGIGTYINNIYILDKSTGQILKYVSTDDGYAKSNYFASSVKPDLSQAVTLGIENSAWVLFKDGSLSKFTRGKSDSLQISGLDKPLSSPRKIYTHADISNVYILDNGNQRIVVLNKSGAYQTQYIVSELKDAVEFEIQEKSKKILFLSKNTIYQITLK